MIAHHYFEARQVKESAAALQLLIEIDPDNPEAHHLLAKMYELAGE
jgi:Tfp pilus assembly protein PilF